MFHFIIVKRSCKLLCFIELIGNVNIASIKLTNSILTLVIRIMPLFLPLALSFRTASFSTPFFATFTTAA